MNNPEKLERMGLKVDRCIWYQKIELRGYILTLIEMCAQKKRAFFVLPRLYFTFQIRIKPFRRAPHNSVASLRERQEKSFKFL